MPSPTSNIPVEFQCKEEGCGRMCGRGSKRCAEHDLACRCPYMFKSEACGYDGGSVSIVTSCAKTPSACKRLGNLERFGGALPVALPEPPVEPEQHFEGFPGPTTGPTKTAACGAVEHLCEARGCTRPWRPWADVNPLLCDGHSIEAINLAAALREAMPESVLFVGDRVEITDGRVPYMKGMTGIVESIPGPNDHLYTLKLDGDNEGSGTCRRASDLRRLVPGPSVIERNEHGNPKEITVPMPSTPGLAVDLTVGINAPGTWGWPVCEKHPWMLSRSESPHGCAHCAMEERTDWAQEAGDEIHSLKEDVARLENSIRESCMPKEANTLARLRMFAQAIVSRGHDRDCTRTQAFLSTVGGDALMSDQHMDTLCDCGHRQAAEAIDGGAA